MASEGIPFVLAAGVFMIALALTAILTDSYFVWGLAAFQVLLFLFMVFFFRDPDRIAPEGENLVLSAADGKVVVIEERLLPEISESPLIQISVFLSIFNVHVNRVPVDGRVEEVKYNPGKFLAAWNEKASTDNEQTLISVDSKGVKVYFKQIAGLVARRISCGLEPGQQVRKGERFGLIRFGSRVDVLLPKDSEVRVKVGDNVKGGETILGVLPSENY